MFNQARLAIVAFALITSGTVAAADDRPPTLEERASTEGSLKALGVTSWKKIKLDDDKWEIDDALHSDGKTYDLELDPASLTVVKQELD